jgi:hypothetical protein
VASLLANAFEVSFIAWLGLLFTGNALEQTESLKVNAILEQRDELRRGQRRKATCRPLS